MSRHGYSDFYDSDDNGALYRGRVERVITSIRGQAFMREMVACLDAMPVKQLAAEVFVEPDPYADDGALQVCAMGAVALARGIDTTGLSEAEPMYVADALGIHEILAAEIAYMNDEWFDRVDANVRHARMRDWAASQIIPERKPTPRGRCSWCCKRFTLSAGVLNQHSYLRGPCPGVGLAPMDRDGVNS